MSNIDDYKMTRAMRKQHVRGDLTIEQVTQEVRRLAQEHLDEMIYNTNRLFYLSVAMFLHDKEGYGKKRLKRAVDFLQNQLDCYCEGYLDLDDMAKTLREECDFEIIVEEK